MSEFIIKQNGDPIPVLIIDLINHCNYRCIMCPQGNKDKDFKSGVMSWELYCKIMDELATPPMKARVIIPFWNGEPALYPYFKKAIDYAAKVKEKNPDCWEVWSLHTNFSLINPEVSRSIIKSKLFGPITVSLDAVFNNTYQNIRRGGDLDKVVKNVKEFLRIRDELGMEFPSLTLQFIVMDENKEESSEFIDFWKDELKEYNIVPNIIMDENNGMEKDTIFIRRCMADHPSKQEHLDNIHREALIKNGIIENSTKEKIVESSEYIEKEGKEERREPCVGLWQHFGIKYNGDTSACCRDFNCEMSLGNINESSIYDIWNGEKLKDLRKYHIRGEFSNIKICEFCTGQPFGILNKNILREYFKSIDYYEDVKEFIQISDLSDQ